MLPTTHDDMQGLSRRQRTVLALLATGLSPADVSDVLQVPVDEVRAEVRNIIRALGVCSKLEAVVIGLRDGLI